MNVNQKSLSLRNTFSVSKLALDGVLAALGVVLMLLVRFPLVPAAPWMLYDMGDLPAIIGGLIAGPVHGLLILLVVCLIQLLTPNASGFYGFLMHFVASGILVLIPSLVWRKSQKQSTLVVSLIVAALAMTAVMIPMNLWITPLFAGVPYQAVVDMIVPILLPFNLIKGLINTLGSFLIFQGVKGVAKKHFA